MLRTFIVAGEPSGDQLGAALMAGLKTDGDVAFDGVGGVLMAEEGLTSRFPMEELSVMGLTEVLPRLPSLLRRIRETSEVVLKARPDVLITIDSPDFCLRVAKRVKKQLPDLLTVHYVAPSVWAWRAGRAAKMAKSIDHVLALLPFEPPYMEAAGMTCDFVGHPVAQQPVASDAAVAAFRESHDIGDRPLLCLLPGSRRGEIARQGPVYRAAVEALAADISDLAVVLPVAGPVQADVAEVFDSMTPSPVLVTPDMGAEVKRTAFRAADLALASSGTVSLELARQGTPMVIGYQMAPISAFLVKRLITLDTATLVNIVTNTRAVPEFLLEAFEPGRIAASLAGLLQDDAARAAQISAGVDAIRMLGGNDAPPGLRAARSIRARLNKASGAAPKA